MQTSNDIPDPAGPIPALFAAIVRGQTVTATYNRGEVTLAPHVLYTKHDALHVDAITLDRDGKPPREVKIGTYRVDGLGNIALGNRRFTRSPLFEPKAEKYLGVTLMAIETA